MLCCSKKEVVTDTTVLSLVFEVYGHSDGVDNQ